MRRKRVYPGSSRNKSLAVAIVFIVCASVSALVHAASRTVEVLDIDTVILRGSSELEIRFDDESSLRVRGSEEALDRQPFFVRGKTLYLGYSESGKQANNVKYKLTARELGKIKLDGSGTIYVKPVKTDTLDVVLQGSGDIRLFSVEANELNVSLAGSGNIQLAEATAKELSVDLAGSGDIDLGKMNSERMSINMSGSGDIVASEEGVTEELDVGLAGSGDITVDQVRAQRADIGIAGSGDVSIWVEQDLEASILGSGDVRYRGNPRVDSSVLGSGDIERAD